ncbi:hypothetical protein [Pedobacter caeni]|uniref:DUF4440 domain-containing protein n=1 Tax=Pedobacter caeni TaxID=288992 RepID=A0A1M5AUQ2_9SPHI|nr:hypothetical protein [Pedobacter caeni]SHF33991.1 hypothetical protein SAMN04488522_102898 [Pedobacter caeni]
MNLNELASQEIVHFHEQIGKWFRGEMSPNEKEEMLALSGFHTNFRMISPTGAFKNRTDLAEWLPSVYAAKPGIVLEVKDINLRFELQDAIMMEYVETQVGGGADNKRISTALFVRNEEGHLQWLDLHETFLP